MSVLVRLGLLAGLWLSSASVFAQELSEPLTAPTAHEIVRDASGQVMAVVEEAHVYADEDPQRYYRAVHHVLDPVIDYRGFAKSVMGPYASKERYQSLDEAGREQLRQQLDNFTQVMRTGLVRTYGKGLLAFSGSRIEISDPTEEELAATRVSVRQLIFSDEVEPYVVMYQMGKSRDGKWMLRNVIIETVNLGEIYRNQFQSAARKYDGDLNAVIDNWEAEEVDS
jgi:phospholipid transport system substrate-binding protein